MRDGSLDQVLAARLDELERAGLCRTLPAMQRCAGAEVVFQGHPSVDFSSNDYLGLARDPRVAQAAISAVSVAGTGAGAARLISGNHPFHEALESALACLKRTEAALLFTSGWLANVGTIPALVGRGDAVYADALNHASLIDGCRLSRAEVRVFPHKDMVALGALLSDDCGRFQRRLIVVDGVFSMDGDLFPLDELVRLARQHDAWTYVDDAHGTGVLGSEGGGVAEHFGVQHEVDVLMGTLGKAFGTAGAFVAGSRTLIEYLRNRARSFIFTTAGPPALAAATLAALQIAVAEPWRRARVRAHTRRLADMLTGLGCPGRGGTDVPVVPIILGDAAEATRIADALLHFGFLVGAIRPPTVPPGTARLRITLSAIHTTEQVDALAEALAGLLVLRD